MPCPDCRHVSREENPKFCSNCGLRLQPAGLPGPECAPPPVAPGPEGALEGGQELKEEAGVASPLHPSDWQQDPDEPSSDSSWITQKSKKRRKRSKLASVSKGPESCSLPPTGPCAATHQQRDTREDAAAHEPERKGSIPVPREEPKAVSPGEVQREPGTVKAKERSGQRGSVEPDAPKQPTEARGGDGPGPAAGKAKKEQCSEKAKVAPVPNSSLNADPGVTVYFHAILSKDFAFNPDHDRVVIRGGSEFGEPAWQRCVCEMTCSRLLEGHGFLVEGSTFLARCYLDKPIPYKYVVVRGPGSLEYEFIYKPAKKLVNRCLLVKSTLLSSGDWHQYDDIICVKSTRWKNFSNYFTDSHRKDVVKGKQLAAAVMLESVFSILGDWSVANVAAFSRQLQQLFCVLCRPMVYEDGLKVWTELEYGDKEVKEHLWSVLREKLAAALCGTALPQGWPPVLQAGLLAFVLGQELQLPMTTDDLGLLCQCLCSAPAADAAAALRNCPAPVFSTSRSWESYLASLCQCCRNTGVQLWVCVLPLLHLTAPQAPPAAGAEHQSEAIWAGLKDISFSTSREKKPEQSKLLELMGKYRHLLVGDPFLLRSWFSLLHLDQLDTFMSCFRDYLSSSPAELLDCLWGTYFRLCRRQEVCFEGLASESIEAILKSLLYLLENLENKTLWETLAASYLSVALKLHRSICERIKRRDFYKLPALSAQLVCSIVVLKQAGDSAAGREGASGDNSVTTIVQGTLTATREWIGRMFQKSMLQVSKITGVTFTYREEIKVWKELVDVGFPAELGWQEALLGDMEGRLKQEKPHAQISAFCSSAWDSVGTASSVAKRVEKCAIEAVNSSCQSQASILDGLSCQDQHKLSTLLSAVVTASWPRHQGTATDKPDEVLKHLLTCPDALHVFRLLDTGDMLRSISTEARELMAMANSVFNRAVGDLRSGAITLKQLELTLQHEKQFLDIWQIRTHAQEGREQLPDLQLVLQWRRDELWLLEQERAHVGSLLQLCAEVQLLVEVDVSDLEERHKADLGEFQLLSLVEVILSPAEPADRRGTKHFYLSNRVRDMAAEMHLFRASHVFHTFWNDVARELHDQYEDKDEDEDEDEDEQEEASLLVLRLKDAYNLLYQPCRRKFQKLYQDLKSGEVTFGDVDYVFRDFRDKYDDLASDLQLMCALGGLDPGHWVPERVMQIREFQHLHQAVDSAQVILKVKDILGLTGDFSILQTLLSFTDNFAEFRHKKLKEMNRQFIRSRQLLHGMTKPQHQCLQELSLRKEFVDWVKDALEGGVPDLKVFVDLASISAGENDLDVDRVACFHDAVLGYASLLFKLESGAGFLEFMEQLKEVWKALESDRHLSRKLGDSARNLDWLKTVRESHGSVELSSLSLATAINSKGVYVIEAPADGQEISPDTVVRLFVRESHDERDTERECSLEELRELLNKLMLLSGLKEHGATEVELFSEVFSNVERLVAAFTQLHGAGHTLFRDWRAEVHCGAGEGTVVLDFRSGLGEQLEGHGPVAGLLAGVCRELEAFLGRWWDFVAEQRAQHFYLNFYTAEQLVLLGSELCRQPPGADALTLLTFLLNSCTPGDVASACEGLGDRPAACAQGPALGKLPPEAGLVAQLRGFLEQSVEGAFPPSSLSLGDLGRCLAVLASRGRSPVQRVLPRGLNAGRPNLVLCSPAEVLPAALALYMHSPEQPLPSYDEALLCGPDTPFEDVELLLRRCLAPDAPGRSLYSLLFADRLSFEVSRRAEMLFQQLCSRPHREDFQLVLLCDDQHEHSYLPAAFSRDKALVTPRQPLPALQAYLARHLQVPVHTPAVFHGDTCVGLVTSHRAGVGKSLYVRRLYEQLRRKVKDADVPMKVIRLTGHRVDEPRVLAALLPFLDNRYQQGSMLVHLDVTSAVLEGTEEFLFKLFVLRCLSDATGKMWLRNPRHLYVVETLEGPAALGQQPVRQNTQASQTSLLDIFPKVTCRTPKDVMAVELSPEGSSGEPGMDVAEFRSETFQRPYQYLSRFFRRQSLDAFTYVSGSVEGSPGQCLQLLLIHCGLADPSWAELRNFVQFLNVQLRDCEHSLFCNLSITGDTLRGFKDFVVTFMILMARDFATPTLQSSDQSPGQHSASLDGIPEQDLAPFSLRKRWEAEPHPYAFFNNDRITMTFIGFHVQANHDGSVDAIDPRTGTVLKRAIMNQRLLRGLQNQCVPFNLDFDELPRSEKLDRLRLALGIPLASDPDETYELTTDNMLKILAIEMRFRCGIPVIIMGETGCGKTRLVKFLSELRRGRADAETLRLVKVHGGTTASMIHAHVRKAQALALHNRRTHQLDTILFLDEANTSEAISCIKEVLCDRTVDGWPLAPDSGLHIIAACNPYRKHTQETIERLESAGLGYRVRAEETAEKLGSVPLRQLVYRVHALPPSLVPLVWDFGQLQDATEKLYIRQIVRQLAESLPLSEPQMRIITDVLSASQAFRRSPAGGHGSVSLRDVERCGRVFTWFLQHSQELLQHLSALLYRMGDVAGTFARDPVLWSLVLAAGVCYHAGLEEKEPYWRAMCRLLPAPYNSSRAVLQEIGRVQDLFLDGVALRATIARNLALKENVFMMVLCIELKIPLFLVGKPGSSKSLAKAIVADAMQGPAAPSELFRGLKQAHLVSFQCSPHSTPQGIVSTFRQCARFQQGKDLNRYVAVVVLDEVGLAEDSPTMPLKALHPLLEDGCIEDAPAPHKKVGFIGISNWALDPAKMNRGLSVSRGSPSEKELVDSARGICSSEPLVQARIQGYFGPFARAYEQVCRLQDREFFGLRDYYSLIKMVFAAARTANQEPSPQEIAHAVLRNFSGKDNIDALRLFRTQLPVVGTNISTMQMIRENVLGLQQAAGSGLDEPDTRYLLVLTRNYAALPILQQCLLCEHQAEILFGSSFPRDQEYSQICRNINRVKVCMETGRTVLLLNLQNLYESLYDALNQYYVHLGGQKYVDLGLGTHRVKCRVHPNFRLVVIEEKDVVYRLFPIPLINRLEKHYLDLHTVLEFWQQRAAEELQRWAHSFAHVPMEHWAGPPYDPSDVFVGFHEDACAAVVLQVSEQLGARTSDDNELYQRVLEAARLVLLDSATPDAVVRLPTSALDSFAAKALAHEYYERQQHDSLVGLLRAQLLVLEPACPVVLTEVTTFSRLLTSHDLEELKSELQDWSPRIWLLSLQQFDTECSFLREVRACLSSGAQHTILIIQMDFQEALHSAQLLAAAKFTVMNEVGQLPGTQGCIQVYFVTKLSRMGASSCYVGFQGGLWRTVHLDDLRRATAMVSDITKLQDVALSQLFQPEDGPRDDMEPADGTQEAMDTESDLPVETSEEVDMESPGSVEEAPERARGQVLDTIQLLRSCIQGAVGLLRDPQEGSQRSIQRVDILLSLLTEDSLWAASFLRVLQLRLWHLLKQQEELTLSPTQWVARVASNQEALQEAGTFRHTLWKRVQAAVTPLLADILAIIDRENNLSLLVRPGVPGWVQELWMFIFSDMKLLHIPLVTGNSRARGETPCVRVQSCMHLLGDSNTMPFSWRIKEHLEELWAQAQYISGAQGLAEKLVHIFQQTPLGCFLAQLGDGLQQELLETYSTDFLLLTMRVSTKEELQLLQVALGSCIRELLAERPREGLALPWVHLAYQHFRRRLQNLSRILAVQPQILRSLSEDTHSHGTGEMTLDALAALACVELLSTHLLAPNAQAWLQLLTRLSTPLELLCSDAYLQGCGPITQNVARMVRAQWNRIHALGLFVEHVVLGTQSHVPELSQLVTQYVVQLNKCLMEDSDVKCPRPFQAVMRTLCECKEAASRALCRFGMQPCPICLRDAQEPVCLPCDHVYCKSCIQSWLATENQYCPLCLTALPDKFTLQVSPQQREAISKHACFRDLCTSFFLDLVSAVCFRDNTPPHAEVVQALLLLLFTEKPQPRDQSQRRRRHTKALSPFDDVVDKSPVIRSVLLKLLLKYSFHEVKAYLQDYLSMLENGAFIMEDKTELYILFSNCLEDSLHEKTSALSPVDATKHLQEETRFLQSHKGGGATWAASVEGLQELARLRLCLDQAAELLVELQAGTAVPDEQGKRQFLQQAAQFCQRIGNDWLRVYLVRRLASQHGLETTQHLTAHCPIAQWVLPAGIQAQQRDQLCPVDGFLVYGEDYKAVRETVGKSVLDGELQAVTAALKASKKARPLQATHLLLALFREVSAPHAARSAAHQPELQPCQHVDKFIQDSKVLSAPALKHFATSLVTHTLPLLSAGLEGSVVDMAVHAAVVLLCGQSPELEPLRNLAFAPATMAEAFLPTMPEDLMTQARHWPGLEMVHWYECPNGHPCSIGECGMPMEESFCVDCRAPIGGRGHRPREGFHKITDNIDRTQTGHVLGEPLPQDQPVVSDRELPPGPFLLLRLLTHLALLLGATHSPQDVGRLIKPPVRDPVGFLKRHLQSDLEQLVKMLGRTKDESANTMHLALRCLLQVPSRDQNPHHAAAQLHSREARNLWEKRVGRLLLAELEHLDQSLLALNELISRDERISSSPVAKIVFGDPATFLPHLPRDSGLHCSRMWRCRRRPGVAHLRHLLEQKNARESVPVLSHFLQHEAELRLLKFLPEILALQKSLVKQFQNVSEVQYRTMDDFINSQKSEGLKQQFRDQVGVFLSTWNKLRRSLQTNGEIKLPTQYCIEDLDLKSPFEILLPRRRGLGLCSTALASYLIALHNAAVYKMDTVSQDASSYTVDASEVSDLHVISYELERDLHPLILSCCQYSVEQGAEALLDVDLDKLQRQLLTRFLQGKPRVTLKGLPTLVCRQDWNYEHLFRAIRSKMAQSPLGHAARDAIGGQLLSYSDACEALSVVEVTLGFLSTSSSDPDMPLSTYVHDLLRMRDQTPQVLEALARCQLRHAVALWQFLSAHRSEQLLRLRREPFGDISPEYREELSPGNSKLLQAFLNRASLDAFLLELHHMIVLKLKAPEWTPNWSLRETLASYLDPQESEVLPELEAQFPEDIPLSSCVAVWKAAAKLKWNRQAR
uniref:E3 ubiquitin-protein ligase RNF213 n=1 Tax=Sorex fumeus TaxID=62283 RepID=UPI0024AC9CBE|nr:E3 ubiquitin-protein ligase RNF213 [Sorex fumeus]